MNTLDVAFRKADAYILKAEAFAADPISEMKKIYAYLGEDFFSHDFKNVEDTSIDPDYLYLFKYPHDGSGEIAPRDMNEWKNYFSDDFAQLIMNNVNVKLYCQAFDYGFKKQAHQTTNNELGPEQSPSKV